MGSKPVTVTFLVGGLLWALWHWRRVKGVGTPKPASLTDSPIQPAPFDAGARLAATETRGADYAASVRL